MLSEKELIEKYKKGDKLVISIIGDSTTAGIAANVGPNLWSNGVSYAATNQPNAYPNLTVGSPYYIAGGTYPSKAQQDNLAIPTAVRQLRTMVEAKNPTSVVTSWGISGWDAIGHIRSGTAVLVAAQVPKPDVVIINLGINSAKNHTSMLTDLRTLVDQVIAHDIFVVLAQPNNIGVVGSPSGSWDQTSTPDYWFPLDYWPNTVNEIKTIRDERSTGFANVGTDDLQLDITKLYDPFHPNEDGFLDIANRYIEYFKKGTLIPESGAMIKTANGKSYYQPVNGNQAFKIKLSTGQVVAIPLTSDLDSLRLKIETGLVTFEK